MSAFTIVGVRMSARCCCADPTVAFIAIPAFARCGTDDCACAGFAIAGAAHDGNNGGGHKVEKIYDIHKDGDVESGKEHEGV